ncbi:MAG: nucleotidyl transferase AbiEii/AbiGii toxin family protein [Vulcanimicrobiota bacterium]
MVTFDKNTTDAIAAARSVLLEVSHVLGEYRDNIVVIGGWVPRLIVSNDHLGSLDVDLALDHRNISDECYCSMQELLLARGYFQKEGDQPFRFYRSVTIDEKEIIVELDLLAGEYEGTGQSRRHQNVQNIKLRKARGSDLAFELYEEVIISGILPGGGEDSTTIHVASIVSFLVMKGMALHDRLKEKDAWDIYFCIRHFPGGMDALVHKMLPHRKNKLVQEGLSKIKNKFSSVNAVGPKFVADFEGITDEAERALIMRDAFERVNYMVDKVLE